MSEYVRHVTHPEKSLALRLSCLDIELTERCNNNCIHCYINLPAHDEHARAREMRTEQVKDILRQVAGLGCLRVRFTGGEPLLRPDFEELYLCARRLGMKVLLYTNGTLITAHLADLFCRIPPLEPVEITVYGMHRDSYEAVTGVPGSFAAFRRGMDLLLKDRIPFVVKCALLPANKAEMDDFEALVGTLPATGGLSRYVVSLDLRGRRDSAEKNGMIASLRLAPAEVVAVLARRGERYLREMRSFCSRFTRPPGAALFSCGAGKGAACVDAYGRLQMCMSLRHPETTFGMRAEGDGGAKGDREAFPLEKAFDLFRDVRSMRAANPDYLARCARCFLKGLCDQCPGKSWMEHGTLDTPVDYLCRTTHAKARHLGLITQGENTWEVRDWERRIRNFVREET